MSYPHNFDHGCSYYNRCIRFQRHLQPLPLLHRSLPPVFTTIAATPCTALSTTGPTVALHQLCALGCILGQLIFDRHPLQPCGLALPAVLRSRPREGLLPLRHDPSPCIISYYYVDFYRSLQLQQQQLPLLRLSLRWPCHTGAIAPTLPTFLYTVWTTTTTSTATSSL